MERGRGREMKITGLLLILTCLPSIIYAKATRYDYDTEYCNYSVEISNNEYRCDSIQVQFNTKNKLTNQEYKYNTVLYSISFLSGLLNEPMDSEDRDDYELNTSIPTDTYMEKKGIGLAIGIEYRDNCELGARLVIENINAKTFCEIDINMVFRKHREYTTIAEESINVDSLMKSPKCITQTAYRNFGKTPANYKNLELRYVFLTEVQFYYTFSYEKKLIYQGFAKLDSNFMDYRYLLDSNGTSKEVEDYIPTNNNELLFKVVPCSTDVLIIDATKSKNPTIRDILSDERIRFGSTNYSDD